MKKVTLVRSPDHYEGVKRSLIILKSDLIKSLSRIPSLVIKVNFVDPRVKLSTTPFEAVKSFVDFITPFYKGKIIIAEETTRRNVKIDPFQEYGFTKLAENNPQVKLFDLFKDQVVKKKIKYAKGEVTLPLAKTIVKAPFLVSIVRPKTHCRVVVTLGIKNVLIGSVPGYLNRLKIHKGKFIHSIMTQVAKYAFPDLVIIDGTVGMEGETDLSEKVRKKKPAG